MLKLTNTLTGKKEEFEPLHDKEVGMYTCGPTVYNFAHIGNLRSYVFADVLRRSLEWEGFKVKQIINITDVGHLTGDSDESGEDKMVKALKREGKPQTKEAMREIADFYFEKFKEDITKLNIELPEKFPFATDHIDDYIKLIEILLEKGFAYKISDGIYFDTSKFPEYGKLGNIKLEAEDQTQSRVGVNTEKKNFRDFSLWKFGENGWVSPWGKGFPGWHIECSAMAMKYLGETFDIHTGGIDHIPTHHNNEIAQSESATGKPFANYWLHNAHVITDGAKMAKSEDNFIQLNTLIKRGIHPLAYRYWLLQARYNSQINFTWEAVEAAQVGFKRLVQQFTNLAIQSPSSSDVGRLEEYRAKFKDFTEDDLNTPEALALIWELLRDESVIDSDKRNLILDFDKVLGLNIQNTNFPTENIGVKDLPEEIQQMISERGEARKNKDFQKSDKLREKIISAGYSVEDKPAGPEIYKI